MLRLPVSPATSIHGNYVSQRSCQETVMGLENRKRRQPNKALLSLRSLVIKLPLITNLMSKSRKNFSVLMADDSNDDRFFMRLALRDDPAFNLVAEVENGEEVISYLSGSG